ncbi:hypothetical protein SEA_BAILEYBLU_7 [Arthrobacter phage BaileyBlu]|uniref:Uncharacterized protein n=1 Tax=Arthrobacter phage BaileyBlu TaxID=2910754 RepID=A0AA49BP90_9CAUD|nr:hypothetical protein PQD78_gp07 [Arthrobacter phage BaileyBlu]UJQ87146.1 hypothetical protein SEA_BAILEYBLU_7 [Arthrobacter phage BaileyBlu]
MPKVTHVATGVTVSVSDAKAESLTGSVWRLAEEAGPATKTTTNKAPAKRARKAPAATETDD